MRLIISQYNTSTSSINIIMRNCDYANCALYVLYRDMIDWACQKYVVFVAFDKNIREIRMARPKER